MPKRKYEVLVYADVDLAMTVKAGSKKRARKKAFRRLLKEYVRISLREK